MVAGSILPVTIYKNQLYFLFGKENPMENSSKGWSDFGGGLEHGETPYITALREGSEELTGFLGKSSDIDILIKKNGGFYEIIHNDYHVHLFFMEYDENLTKYYNNNHKFLWDKMDNNLLNGSKLFEKIEIHWFSLSEMKKRKREFRTFYRDIVDIFIGDIENIRKFIDERMFSKRKNKTIKKTTK